MQVHMDMSGMARKSIRWRYDLMLARRGKGRSQLDTSRSRRRRPLVYVRRVASFIKGQRACSRSQNAEMIRLWRYVTRSL